MTLKDDLDRYVKATFRDQWKVTDTDVVPDPEDLPLGNEAIRLDATVLYADLADSTALVRGHKPWFAAEIYKNYLYCAARIIRAHGGAITAYDGDRVMAVFVGGQKNSQAAKAALKINWTVLHLLRPAQKAQYPQSTYTIRQKVGIDTSSLYVARTGIRGSNDLVWVGNAANNAAKMAALPATYSTYISAATYNMLLDTSKYGGDPKRNMWTDLGTSSLGFHIYGSTFWWSL